MLAWAIENSDPDKLKEIREVAEKVEAGEKNGTKRVLTSDEEALIGAESASMARGAVEMARYVISHKNAAAYRSRESESRCRWCR